jgi:hypothetical protein
VFVKGELTKNHIGCFNQSSPPVLVTAGEHTGGPFAPSVIPLGCSDTAGAIVMRALARESRPNDPKIEVEPGGDLDTYMMEYLGISEEQLERAETLAKIAKRRKNK